MVKLNTVGGSNQMIIFFTLTKLHQKYQLGHVSAQIFTSECEYIKCFTELAAYCNFVVQRSTVSNQHLD